MREVVVAGGCFWGVEAYYRRLKGVLKTEVGYSQGSCDHTTYNAVCQGEDSFVEVCKISYNEQVLSLEKIIEHLFRFIDPTSLNQQGPDKGIQYRTGVYYTEEQDLEIILEALKKRQESYEKALVVECEAVVNYCSAENYHQSYLEKNPYGYCHVNLSLLSPEECEN